MSILERLPAELRIRVLDFCGDGDLAQLCLVSQHVHDICVALLTSHGAVVDLLNVLVGRVTLSDRRLEFPA